MIAGFPSGSDLVRLIKQEIKEEDARNVENKTELSTVAEEFVQLYSRARLEEILVRIFSQEPSNLHYHKLMSEIPQISHVITTNYDLCFEHAYENRHYKVVKDADVTAYPKQGCVTLYKVHGDVIYPETMLITNSDYTKFYQQDRENLVWNKIRSLMSEKSVLFIGYSLEDSNVKFTLDDIFERLGPGKRDWFLIAPHMPLHKRRHLEEKYSIQYIDLTAQKAINKISRVVEKNLLTDAQYGYIPVDAIEKAIEGKGVKPRFALENGKFALKSITPLDDSVKILGSITYCIPKEHSTEMEKIDRIVTGRDFGECELSSKQGKLRFKSRVGQMDLIETKRSDQISIQIKSTPQKRVSAELILSHSDRCYHNVKGNHYLSKYAAEIELTPPGFVLRIYINKENKRRWQIGIKLHHPDTVAQGYDVYGFFADWIKSDELQIFVDFLEQPLVIPFSQIAIRDEFTEAIRYLYELYSDLFEIQKCFKIKFPKFEDIPDEDYLNVKIVKKLINGELVKLPPIQLNFSNVDERKFVESVKNGGYFEINGLKTVYQILGKNVSIDNCTIQVHDGYFENNEELVSEFLSGAKEFKGLLCSKTGSIHLMWKQK